MALTAIQQKEPAIRFLSLFSGIEAASVAWSPLGWECAAVAEIEKFPSAVLAHHYPDVPNLGDITKITEQQIKDLGHIDVVVFGFPCQDLSVAGKRAGLNTEDGEVTRSGLFFTAMQIVRWSGARWSLAENVPGIFSSKKGADFAAVVGEMAGAEPDIPKDGWKNSGFLLGSDGLVEWAVLDAQYFGVPQRRRRVFIVRDIGDWASRSPLLLESESLHGNPAPSRKEKQKDTRDSSFGIDEECNVTADGFGPLLRGGQGGTRQAVAFCQNTRDEVRLFGGDGQSVGALAAQPGMKQTTYVAVPDNMVLGTSTGNVAHCLNAGGMGRQDYETETMVVHARDEVFAVQSSQSGIRLHTTHATLDANNGSRRHNGVLVKLLDWAVRRLLPVECERLQGFPDNYTLLPTKKQPDGPRYKACGNSMAVPVMAWIGKRMQRFSEHG